MFGFTLRRRNAPTMPQRATCSGGQRIHEACVYQDRAPTRLPEMLLRHTFDHPLHGEVVIEHNPSSGAITIEFERLESEDAIIPLYRVALTAEHVAAWVQWVLTHRYGRRCSLHSHWCAETSQKRGGGGRLHAMLRQTERDAGAAH